MDFVHNKGGLGGQNARYDVRPVYRNGGVHEVKICRRFVQPADFFYHSLRCVYSSSVAIGVHLTSILSMIINLSDLVVAKSYL